VLIRRSLVALFLIAGGFFVVAKESPRAPAVQATSAQGGFASSPSAPEALVAQTWTFFGFGPDGIWGTAQADREPGIPGVLRGSKSGRQSDLIAAQLLEKYRSFRESLTSP
jgi:hypothetical protein